MISNVFTPNGDGDNDRWRVDGLSENQAKSIIIINRWGATVFSHTGSYTDQFDGTYNGTELPIGTYYYIIITADDLSINGNLTILK